MIIYHFIKYLILSIKYNNILNKVYREEKILEGLSTMLGVELRKDWIGRIYAVFNPYIKNGKYDPESPIYEIGSNTSSEMVVEKYIMQRLSIAHNFIHANNLFELLTYKLERVDDYDNFLFVMQPIPYGELFKWSKRLAWEMLVVLLITIIILVCVF